MTYLIFSIITFCINFILLILYSGCIQKFLRINFQYTKTEFTGILFLLILFSVLWPLEIIAIIIVLGFKYLN